MLDYELEKDSIIFNALSIELVTTCKFMPLIKGHISFKVVDDP